jgi:hypothetical protein
VQESKSFLTQPLGVLARLTILVAFITVAFVIGYSAGVSQGASKTTDTAKVTPSPKSTTKVEVKTLQTYNNANLGFSLSYPTGWTAQDMLQSTGSSSDTEALVLQESPDGPTVNLHVDGANLTAATPEATYTFTYSDDKVVLGDRVVSTDENETNGVIQFTGTINGHTYLFTASNINDQTTENTVKDIVSSLQLTK